MQHEKQLLSVTHSLNIISVHRSLGSMPTVEL